MEATAKYSYKTDKPNELSFNEGDELIVSHNR